MISSRNDENDTILQKDFDNAQEVIVPIGKKEGFNMVPDTNWEDVGAQDDLKSELIKAIINPINNPERCKLFNIKPHAGVLLYGLPGCGKTLLAKAIAHAANANFISIKGPELLNKYVGESERAIRSLFQRAKECSPCLIFFDEFDALCPKRGSDGNQVTERIVNQQQTEMNGVEDLRNVYIIGATNRPDIIDSAILRPGRQGTHLYVPIPSKEDRLDILKACTRKMPIDKDIDLKTIAYDIKLKNFTGADISALVENAAKNAAWAGINLRDSILLRIKLNSVKLPLLSKPNSNFCPGCNLVKRLFFISAASRRCSSICGTLIFEKIEDRLSPWRIVCT